jgi:hypothetical protein
MWAALLHYVLPAIMDWNFWNYEPKEIIPPSSCFWQTLNCVDFLQVLLSTNNPNSGKIALSNLDRISTLWHLREKFHLERIQNGNWNTDTDCVSSGNQGSCWDAGDMLGWGKALGRAEPLAPWTPSPWKVSPHHEGRLPPVHCLPATSHHSRASAPPDAGSKHA